jgi:hypothetical protein
MDIFAHALWTGAAARGARWKWRWPVRPLWAALWGVFPDLFAFTVPVAISVVHQLQGVRYVRGTQWKLAGQLYHISHSLIVCAAVLALVWVLARRPVFAMLGWPLHILIDIPSHSEQFYPTPFLWPVSSFHVSGMAWGNRWFMLINYTALLMVYTLIYAAKWRARRKKPVAQVRS